MARKKSTAEEIVARKAAKAKAKDEKYGAGYSSASKSEQGKMRKALSRVNTKGTDREYKENESQSASRKNNEANKQTWHTMKSKGKVNENDLARAHFTDVVEYVNGSLDEGKGFKETAKKIAKNGMTETIYGEKGMTIQDSKDFNSDGSSKNFINHTEFKESEFDKNGEFSKEKDTKYVTNNKYDRGNNKIYDKIDEGNTYDKEYGSAYSSPNKVYKDKDRDRIQSKYDNEVTEYEKSIGKNSKQVSNSFSKADDTFKDSRWHKERSKHTNWKAIDKKSEENGLDKLAVRAFVETDRHDGNQHYRDLEMSGVGNAFDYASRVKDIEKLEGKSFYGKTKIVNGKVARLNKFHHDRNNSVAGPATQYYGDVIKNPVAGDEEKAKSLREFHTGTKVDNGQKYNSASFQTVQYGRQSAAVEQAKKEFDSKHTVRDVVKEIPVKKAYEPNKQKMDLLADVRSKMAQANEDLGIKRPKEVRAIMKQATYDFHTKPYNEHIAKVSNMVDNVNKNNGTKLTTFDVATNIRTPEQIRSANKFVSNNTPVGTTSYSKSYGITVKGSDKSAKDFYKSKTNEKNYTMNTKATEVGKVDYSKGPQR